MNVPLEKLNDMRERMERIRNLTVATRLSYARGIVADGQASLDEAHDLAIASGIELEQYGADRPARMAAPTGFETPLALLDTLNNKRLMAILRDAQEQAQRVDDERGIERGEGAVSGLVGMLLGQVEAECYGPVGASER